MKFSKLLVYGLLGSFCGLLLTGRPVFADTCAKNLMPLFTSFQAKQICSGLASLSFAGATSGVPGATIGAAVTTNTVDGSDSKAVCFGGGGACPGDGTRGGEVLVYGNESSSAGDINIFGGSVAGSNIRISPINASATISLESSGTPQLVISSAGVTSPLTSALGWTIVNSANQACNTTCTSACVFGFNTGALGNLLACTDATADSCLCAGAS